MLNKIYNWFLTMLGTNKPEITLHDCNIAEVFGRINHKDLHDSLISYEILMNYTSNSMMQELAIINMIQIAKSYNWTYASFFEVIEEHYIDMHKK